MTTELPTCFGCYTQTFPWPNTGPNPWPFNVPVTIPPYPNQPVYDNIPAPAPMPTFVPFYDYNGLTEEEKEVLRNLAEAFNKFVALTGKHPSDDSEFCKAIHDAQKMIALRVARRVNPEVWKQYPEENVDKV